VFRELEERADRGVVGDDAEVRHDARLGVV
jgi:hypothetical protein